MTPLTRPLTILTLLLLLTPLTTALHPKPTTLYVDDDNTQGPWDGTPEHPYQHITDAITNATPNDTIYILNGTYHEHPTIPIPLHLQGQNPNTTLVTADSHSTIFTLTADHTTIQDLTLLNSAGRPNTAAIDIHANHTTITHCIIYRHRIGIAITNHTDLTITNCMIHVTQQGLHATNCTHLTITGTYCYHNAIGLFIRNTTNITLTTSYLHTCGIACDLNNDTIIHIDTCAFSDNDDNQGGLYLTNTNDTLATNSYFDNNGVGVNIKKSNNTILLHCTFTRNTHFALKLLKTPFLYAQNCSFTDNIRSAIWSENSTLAIHNNIFQNSSNYGLYATNTTADASCNWWGGFLGPTYISYNKRADRGSLSRSIHYLPWMFKEPSDIGTNWTPATIFTTPEHPDTWNVPLQLPGTDTDGDHAPDWWEIKWGYDPLTWDDHQHLDPDHDGLTNLQECFTDGMNSSPYHKDIFIEFDWMPSHTSTDSNRPDDKYFDKMTQAFAAHNITLHIDAGALGGGTEIPYKPNITQEDIVNDYWDYFLNGDLNNPRKGIFHYALLSDFSSEGNGFAVIGWNDLDSWCISCQALQNNHPTYPRGYLVSAGSFHELGHTLGLIAARYGGIDNKATITIKDRAHWQYNQYKSLMNYWYTYFIFDYSDGTHGPHDYNDWANANLSFFSHTEFRLPT